MMDNTGILRTGSYPNTVVSVLVNFSKSCLHCNDSSSGYKFFQPCIDLWASAKCHDKDKYNSLRHVQQFCSLIL